MGGEDQTVMRTPCWKTLGHSAQLYPSLASALWALCFFIYSMGPTVVTMSLFREVFTKARRTHTLESDMALCRQQAAVLTD